MIAGLIDRQCVHVSPQTYCAIALARPQDADDTRALMDLEAHLMQECCDLGFGPYFFEAKLRKPMKFLPKLRQFDVVDFQKSLRDSQIQPNPWCHAKHDKCDLIGMLAF